MKTNIYRYLLLFIAAFIWGSAFVAQRAGMDHIGPFTFMATRNTVGFLFLIPVTIISEIYLKKNKTLTEQSNAQSHWRFTIKAGILCGLVLFVASSLQQCGLCYTTAGKSGFITALYVILVPIAGIFMHKKNSPVIYIAVILGVIGLFMLCVEPGEDSMLSMGLGEGLTLICAICFTFHILIIDHFSDKTNGIALSCVQFFIVSILSVTAMMIFERSSISIVNIREASVSILYAGIMSSGVAFTFQILGQKGTNPTIASLIMCLESVFSVITGAIILHEQLSRQHIIGCVLMFIAIIISQVFGQETSS